ncbi:MAG: aminotransferase class I/II-fold pyridoxal phosphate-dependent enzyme [Polyangiaceae bacterium]|nr:aminotransferase class I/II-fold pyridoxal phosphate-dependent enzyme [Polyangiaceae bacterium]
MEQVLGLAERIRALKAIAAEMREGRIHILLLPEIDRILALPEDVTSASVGEREAIARQLREYEQTFDRLGYTLLEQVMPTTGVSPIFRIVQAADEFKAALRHRIGKTFTVAGQALVLDATHLEALGRYSLSIGTPPVTNGMRALVARTVFGKELRELGGYTETLACDPVPLERLLSLFGELVDQSLHYSTASEERAFLAEAAEFVNFEGATLFIRAVITESPDRVIDLIRDHVFDKFGARASTPVTVVPGEDRLDDALLARMRAEPNHVYVARVTRIPHHLFDVEPGHASDWRSVIGRLLLIDCSRRARMSNSTVVFTLFPHVARTLRNVQTSFAGRPANTQLVLRRILERFSPGALGAMRAALERGIAFHESEGADAATVEEVRAQEWRRQALFDYLGLKKLRRMVAFLERVAASDDAARRVLSDELEESVAASWMHYLYKSLPPSYHAAVVPGGGRGALTLVGEWHAREVEAALEHFLANDLDACRARLEEIKRGLAIPTTSSDEIEAAMRYSQLQSASPTQWRPAEPGPTHADYLGRAAAYRFADLGARLARRAEEGLDRAAFANVTGAAAAFLKQAMAKAGLGALHGHLEARVGQKVGRAERTVRRLVTPFQDVVRALQRSMDGLKGDLDPQAVGEIEALLQLIGRGAFYPTLVLSEMSWSYPDVFPEKDFPAASTLRVPLNDAHEMDPMALCARLEELRYLFRRFPEIFRLYCRSMLVVVNSPNNPTGVVYRRETVLKLLQIAAAYDLTVLDDDAYHKLVTRRRKAREGDASMAQIYERHRGQLGRPVRIVTVGATTKALQGSGDRTGLVHSNVREVVAFTRERAPEPHLMSLYLTLVKLESGRAAARYTGAVEALAGALLDPRARVTPSERLRALCAEAHADVKDERFPVLAFETLLEGYEELLRLEHRDASRAELSEALSALVRQLKMLRLEVRLRTDIEERFAAVAAARAKAMPGAEFIEPEGAFYACVRLCPAGDDRGVQEFLRALARARKVDLTYAGRGYVRLSLGGALDGTEQGYRRYAAVIELYLGLVARYWQAFDAAGRDPAVLERLFTPHGGDPVAAALDDLAPLLAAADRAARPRGLGVEPSERGIVHCIEEGRSSADKVFVAWQPCATVDEMLQARTFQVLYRRLLRRVWRRHPDLVDWSFERVENQYGPLACLAAYHDRQLIDPVFRDLLLRLYDEWHGPNTVKVLAARLETGSHGEKVAALHGIHRAVHDLLNELLHAFEVPEERLRASTTFEIGYEELEGLHAHAALPAFLGRIVEGTHFAGAITALDPAPRYTTGAATRVSDYRYGFGRRDGGAAQKGRSFPERAFFLRRLERFADGANLAHYVCLALPVGPFKMLVLIHKACFHLVSDALRLFPQIEAYQQRRELDGLEWDAVLLFGIPSKILGDSYKTGYVLEPKAKGGILPIAWVAREDATDYVGFFKKSLLTMHNELTKALGGMPIHGAMFTITFKNGLRKTLVFSADSGTGKSETITAMMDQLVSGEGVAAEVRRVDILAGDMLSLWRGADAQLYAFGTEQGDFLRLTDITESWKARFGDLLQRGSYSNLDHPKNPRVTIPGICDPKKLLMPTRVNGFFYIDNYAAVERHAVELAEDPHHVLKHVLVRGLRKNKGTSGDQPSLRAGLEFAGQGALVTRYRHAIDELLDWQERTVEGKRETCLAYRDGADDVRTARDVVDAAFRGRTFRHDGQSHAVLSVRHDVLANLFWLECEGGRSVALSRPVYDQIYEPLVSTFCGNPFVDPEGMDAVLGRFADTMRDAKVHTGVIRTELARPGFEFAGPARAARDIIAFLLEDEEVSARFQRNKDKVQKAMRRTYGGVLEAGTNLPIELEGYNLLLLEAHESLHVAFTDAAGASFTLATPYYHYQPTAEPPDKTFTPAIAMPDMLAAIADICRNPDYAFDLAELYVDPAHYDCIRFWNSREELVYQVLLVHGVVMLGSPASEVARFPSEVRKADHVAGHILARRAPLQGAASRPEATPADGVPAPPPSAPYGVPIGQA